MSGEAGKGDAYRPVNAQRYREGWERIDWTDTRREPQREEAEQCQTSAR
jgi:hypothetical protein